MVTKRQYKLIYYLVHWHIWKQGLWMRIVWVYPRWGTRWLYEWLLRVQTVDNLHHAPCCPANHYHKRRFVFNHCNCGAAKAAGREQV